MSFIWIFIAGICEICWPLGFKLAQTTHFHNSWVFFSLITMTLSVLFFYLSQKHLPVGIAYPIWTGIGASGTFLISTFYFHDIATWLSWVGLMFIITDLPPEKESTFK